VINKVIQNWLVLAVLLNRLGSYRSGMCIIVLDTCTFETVWCQFYSARVFLVCINPLMGSPPVL
jgi:hypothetical protein